jgi:hypothetical protein
MNDLQTKLDRLADGELSRQEYAALLSSLDHEDEGWKKCALTFLEGQALRTDFRKLIDEPTPPSQSAPAMPASSTTKLIPGWYWIQSLAVAACLGLAFWLGRGSVAPDDIDPAGAGPQAPKIAADPGPRSESWKQGRMTLVVNGADGRPREVEVPVVDGNYVDPRAFLARSSAIPSDVLEALQQSGHKIEREREFMRQPIDAEHEVVVPVDHLRVVPVSNPMY